MTSVSSSVPEVSVIIVSYNTQEMTLAAIASVYAQTTVPFEIIVVDNNSPDGSAEAIAEAFPDVTLLAETKNHWFAPAHDLAVPLAKAPWLLLLNPDTVVQDGAIDKLLAFAKRTPEAGIWGGRTVFGDGRLNPASCWRRMSLWTIFCRVSGLTGIFKRSGVFNAEEYAGWKRDTERPVDIVTGCFLLMKRETWDDLDGFDPAFVMYGEEADLCLRARATGMRPRITPEATIVHYGAASEPVAADRIIRVLKAKMELIRRHFPPATRWLGAGMFRFFPLTRWIATSAGAFVLRKDRLKLTSQVWRAVWTRRYEWVHGFQSQK